MATIRDNRGTRPKAVAYINPTDAYSVDDVIKLISEDKVVIEVYEYTNADGEIRTAIAIKEA
jgi:hypothetical protein